MENLATRIVPGFGHFVQLNMSDDCKNFEVTVDGKVIYSGKDGKAASDAYLHTFVKHPLELVEVS